VAFELVAGSCDGGDCPSIFINPETGDVRVRGADVDDPQQERDVQIPAAAWARLMAVLPR
jgi:hypothetical protein